MFCNQIEVQSLLLVFWSMDRVLWKDMKGKFAEINYPYLVIWLGYRLIGGGLSILESGGRRLDSEQKAQDMLFTTRFRNIAGKRRHTLIRWAID